MNYRFKVRENSSEVTITLRPGQSLSWGYSRPDDEGYSYYSVTWEHTEHGVRASIESGGRDCDGRIDRGYVLFCKTEDLKTHEWQSCIMGDETIYRDWPKWEEEESQVYDEYAQAMGY